MEKNICNCECHIYNSSIIHSFPCCKLCYEQYITIDGKIDLELLEKLKYEKSLRDKRDIK